MVSKNFRTICVIRLLLLCLSVCGVVYLLVNTRYYATMILALGITAVQVYSLLMFLEKTNLELTRFLEAIRHADFSQSFSTGVTGSGFEELRRSFNEVFEAFRQARAEKEEQYRYLQTVVQHVGVGLLCYQANGEVELVNNAARRLLNTANINNLRSLEPLGAGFVSALQGLKAGQKTLLHVEYGGENSHLAISATELHMRGKKFTLVSIQNIQSELEEKEMEAWQNLVRVLTHEIMNSITPISSLASTANEMLNPRDGSGVEEIDSETLADVREAVQTIRKRSQGLLHFVDTYREMTRIPKPAFRLFSAREMLGRVQNLMQPELEKNRIEILCSVQPETLELTADPELIEQVLINLVLNSIQALDSRPEGRIEVSARLEQNSRPVIKVRDNGPGILDEVREKYSSRFLRQSRRVRVLD